MLSRFIGVGGSRLVGDEVKVTLDCCLSLPLTGRSSIGLTYPGSVHPIPKVAQVEGEAASGSNRYR